MGKSIKAGSDPDTQDHKRNFGAKNPMSL